MPTVPRAQRTVETAPLRGGQLAQAPAGAFGGMEKVFSEAERIYENERVKLDEARLSEERRVFFDQFEYPSIYDPKTGAANLRGRDAIGIGQKIDADFDTFVSERMKGLSTERQRQAYQQWAVSRKEGIRKWSAGHEAAQVEAYMENEHNAGIESAKERGSVNPANAPLELAYIRQQVAQRGQDKGWGEDFINQELKKHETDLHSRVLGNLLANDQDEAAKAYYDANETAIDPDRRRELLPKIREANKSRVIMTKATDLWGRKGPKGDNDAVDVESLAEEARKLSDDPETVKGIITDIRDRATLHNQAIKERDGANLSAIWDAYDKGATKAQVRAMPEYRNLSNGALRVDISDRLDRYAEAKVREAKASTREEQADLRAEQEINRAALASNPALLREADLDDMLRNKELSPTGYRSLQVLKDPKKQPAARAAFKRLDDAKTKRLFNSADDKDNQKQWVEFTGMLHTFLENNPDGDPAAFVEEVMKPVELTWKEAAKDFWFGTPGTENAIERRKQELRAISGTPRQAAPAGKVKVISPDGKAGFIPAGQLAEAIKAGYRESR